jgi:hypothetical protein
MWCMPCHFNQASGVGMGFAARFVDRCRYGVGGDNNTESKMTTKTIYPTSNNVHNLSTMD